MAINYADLAAKAAALIRDSGAPIELVRLGTTPADASEPWRGANNPRLPAAESRQLSAVGVDPSAAGKLGFSSRTEDFVQRAARVFLVEAPAGVELENFDELVADVRYRILAVDKLRPAKVTLLYAIWVGR